MNSVNWNDYEPYDPGTTEPPEALPRKEARRVFQKCMESKPARLESLTRLLKANGIELTTEDSAIQALNDWFSTNVEADPDRPGSLLPIWYSVCHDIALFLGDVMIERHPNLRWEFFIWGKTSVAFQRHVIMGFSTEDPKFRTNIDIAWMVTGYGHRIVESQGSIPTYGTVEVRGVAIDVDAIAASHRSTKSTKKPSCTGFNGLLKELSQGKPPPRTGHLDRPRRGVEYADQAIENGEVNGEPVSQTARASVAPPDPGRMRLDLVATRSTTETEGALVR